MANRGIVTWVEFVGTPYVTPPEGFLSPSGDVSDGSWTTQAGGTALAAVLDEATRDDSDYVQSNSAVLNDTFEVYLSDPGGTFSNGVLVFAIGKKTNNSDVVDFAVELRQGTTVIASWIYADVAYGTVTKSEKLTDAQFAAITDFTDLRVRVTAGRFWTPLVESTLEAWYDCNDLSTVTVATGLSSLVDKSGKGRTITQATGGSQPPFNTSTRSAQPTGTQQLTYTSFSAITGTSPRLVVALGVLDSVANSVVIGWGTNSDNLFWGLKPHDATLLKPVVLGWGAADLTLTNSTALTAGTPFIMAGWYTGTVSGGAMNGGTATTGAKSLNTASGTTLQVGNFGGAPCPFNEIILFSSYSQGLYDKAAGYLARKWASVSSRTAASLTNLDNSNPYKNRPPFVGD